MNFFHYFLAVNLLFIPNLSLADTNDTLCSVSGYTVATINGVFTDDIDAKRNRDSLEFKLGKEYRGEKVSVDYLWNPPHLGGLGDIAVSVYQKVFDFGKVEDYDLVEMLKTASEQVRTQKLLLVAHSQGNFYANSFYDVVADQAGGVPKESIGVYGVATPAGRVAGEGKWLTSDTDTVISGIVASAPFKNIMEPNTHIELQNGDDALGHSFSDVYLKYRGAKIISDIQASLDKLSENNIQNEKELCIDPPELTLAHKAMGAVLAVADPIASAGGNAVVGAAVAVHKTNKFIAKVGAQISLAMSQFLRKETDTSGLALVAEINLERKVEGEEGNPSTDSGQEERGDRDNNVAPTSSGRSANNNVGDNQDEDEAERAAKQVATNPSISSGQATNNSQVSAAPVSSVSAGLGGGAGQALSAGSGQGEVTVQQCKYGTGGTPTRQKLIINEVAWMGGTVSANDEWLELKNVSGGELNISGWQVLDKSEQIKITFPSGTKLTSDGLLLLERTDDDSVPSVAADLIYVGALSNTDEGLRLFDNNCVLVDEVTASPDWPAGESATRKTMERASDLSWYTSSVIMGTPKKENSSHSTGSTGLPQEGSGSDSSTEGNPSTGSGTNVADHLVISEVQITGGSGATTNDFIELYNPTGEAINLNGYRLVKRTKTGTSDTSIKSWTSDAFIPAKGFYLWANSSYTSISVTPDATTAATIADDNGVALRQGATDTGIIIDSVGWGENQSSFVEGAVFSTNPGANQSLERKSYSGGCLSSQNSGEFSGNGCDTNSNSNDFELRSTSSPQNSQSFPEPRSAPTAVQTLNASFSSSTMELILNWSESQDYAATSTSSGQATSTITYLLQYATSTNAMKDLATLSATSSYKFIGKELGATYSFSIIPKDRDGLTGSTTLKEFNAVSPLTNLYFYKDTRSSSSQKYLLDFYYNNYPFVPDIYNKGSGRILVFYLNKEAPNEIELNTANNFKPENLEKILDIRYEACASGVSRFSLILPSSGFVCVNGGGVDNSFLKFEYLEDQHLLLELATTTSGVTFTPNDFVTVGMYSFYDSGGGSQRFRLAALDRTKYYFSSSTFAHQSPTAPANLEFQNQATTSLARIVWDKSTDTDTLNSLITYEINYSTAILSDSGWQTIPNVSLTASETAEVGSRGYTKISVEPGNTYNIALRAKDDFGNVSSAATATYAVPDVIPPYGITNLNWGHLSSTSTAEVNFTANSYPFMTADVPSAIVFFLNQLPPASYSFSNWISPYEIGGNNKVLRLNYSSCNYSAGYDLFGGLVLHNRLECPASGGGLKTNMARSNLTAGQISFTTKAAGIFENTSVVAHDFTASDYLTIGFYELSGSIFQEAAAYNKKIYFQE